MNKKLRFKNFLAWGGIIFGALIIVGSIASGSFRSFAGGLFIGLAFVLPSAWYLLHQRRETNGAAPLKRHWGIITAIAILSALVGGLIAPSSPRTSQEDSSEHLTEPETSTQPAGPKSTEESPTTSTPPKQIDRCEPIDGAKNTFFTDGSHGWTEDCDNEIRAAEEERRKQEEIVESQRRQAEQEAAEREEAEQQRLQQELEEQQQFEQQPAPQLDQPPADLNFRSCEEAQEAGYSHMTAGSPGYSRRLDRDGDGIACDKVG